MCELGRGIVPRRTSGVSLGAGEGIQGGDQYPHGRGEPESDLKDGDRSEAEEGVDRLGWEKVLASVGSWHIRQIEFNSILAPDSLCNLNCSVPQFPHL